MGGTEGITIEIDLLELRKAATLTGSEYHKAVTVWMRTSGAVKNNDDAYLRVRDAARRCSQALDDLLEELSTLKPSKRITSEVERTNTLKEALNRELGI